MLTTPYAQFSRESLITRWVRAEKTDLNQELLKRGLSKSAFYIPGAPQREDSDTKFGTDESAAGEGQSLLERNGHHVCFCAFVIMNRMPSHDALVIAE